MNAQRTKGAVVERFHPEQNVWQQLPLNGGALPLHDADHGLVLLRHGRSTCHSSFSTYLTMWQERSGRGIDGDHIGNTVRDALMGERTVLVLWKEVSCSPECSTTRVNQIGLGDKAASFLYTP